MFFCICKSYPMLRAIQWESTLRCSTFDFFLQILSEAFLTIFGFLDFFHMYLYAQTETFDFFDGFEVILFYAFAKVSYFFVVFLRFFFSTFLLFWVFLQAKNITKREKVHFLFFGDFETRSFWVWTTVQNWNNEFDQIQKIRKIWIW